MTDKNEQKEIERLKGVLDRAAFAWLGLEPPVVWEGDLAAAMQAAVNEISRLRRIYEPVPREGEEWWSCLIGPFTGALDDADYTMRCAVKKAFEKLSSGNDTEECFSGWGASPTALQREIIDPSEEKP